MEGEGGGGAGERAPGQGRARRNRRNNNNDKRKPKEKDVDANREGEPGSSVAGEGREPEVKLKVLVRRLPPELSEENFRKQVREGGHEGDYTWMRYWQGKPPEGGYGAAKAGQHHLYAHCSRCYIRFRDAEALGRFHKSFHGHAYMTEKGQRFVASVSFAPNQKCPHSAETSKRGRDAKTNTIHKDGEYKRFLESLERSESEQLPPADVQADAREAEAREAQITVTPLMAYMKKKAAQREKKKRKSKQKERERKKRGEDVLLKRGKDKQQQQKQGQGKQGQGKKKKAKAAKRKKQAAAAAQK